jgi:predicted transcriptional regulator
MTDIAHRILTLTTQIVTEYLRANAVPAAAIPGMIRDIHQSLSGLERHHSRGALRESRPIEPRPAARAAVDAQKSVFPDHIVCLEEGKQATMLKRHLRTAHGLTPEQYRAKWGLPARYPMVAPNYTKVRSRLAKESGLGRNGRRSK